MSLKFACTLVRNKLLYADWISKDAPAAWATVSNGATVDKPVAVTACLTLSIAKNYQLMIDKQ